MAEESSKESADKQLEKSITKVKLVLTDIGRSWDDLVSRRKTILDSDRPHTTLVSLKGGKKSWKSWMESLRDCLSGPTINLPIFEDYSFNDNCKTIIEKMEVMDKKMEVMDESFEKKTYSEIKHQLHHKEVLISIYGDSNVGKSTVINSIMGDWYLPSNIKTETAISVYIHFNNPCKNSASNDKSEDLLRNDEGNTIAKGLEEIQKKLKELNEMTRSEQQSQIGNSAKSLSKKYHLFLSKPLISSPYGRHDEYDLILLDNPGYDEYDCGTGAMERVVEEIQLISTAYIFVITFDTYTKTEVSKQLMSLYSKNPDIFHDKCLTIVINKIDEAVKERLNEPEYTEKEVMSQVRNYLCSSIFKCKESELPEDAVISLSGLNALLARVYKTKSKDKRIERQVRRSLLASSLGLNAEDPEEDMACALEERSHIKVLEKRLQELSQKASQLWKLKMCKDLIGVIERTKKNLRTKIEANAQIVSELLQKLQERYKELMKLNDSYKKVIFPYKQCSEGKTIDRNCAMWIKLKEACDKDMKKKKEIKEEILKGTSDKLDSFKNSTSTKIRGVGYSTVHFEEDLKSLFHDLSEEMSKKMSSQDSLMNVTSSCLNANSGVEDLFNGFKKTLGIAKNVQGNIPKLDGPSFKSFKITVKIPFSERTFWGYVWYFIRSIFWTLPELEKSYSKEFDIENSADLNRSKVIKGIPPVSSSAATSQSTLPHDGQPQESLTGYAASSQSTLPHDGQPHDSSTGSSAAPSQSTLSYDGQPHESITGSHETQSNSITGRFIYWKWYDELEDIKAKIWNDITVTVNKFFEDTESNIVQTCYKQHYDAAIKTLINFDDSAEIYFMDFKEDVENIATKFKQVIRELEILKDLLKCLNHMLTKITKEYDWCREENSFCF